MTRGFTAFGIGMRTRAAIVTAPIVSLKSPSQGIEVPIWLMQPEMKPMMAASLKFGRIIKIERQ